jgi:transcriptional regulatory protein LevR
MKAFIDRIFKKRKKDAEQIEENKKVLAEQIETSIKEKVTQAAVEAIIEEVKEVIKKEEVKKEEVVVYPKPNHFPDCNCFKCVRWIKHNGSCS